MYIQEKQSLTFATIHETPGPVDSTERLFGSSRDGVVNLLSTLVLFVMRDQMAARAENEIQII